MKMLYNFSFVLCFSLFSFSVYSQCAAPSTTAFVACANNPATSTIEVSNNTNYDVTEDIDLSGITVDLGNNSDLVFAGDVTVDASTSFTGNGNASIEGAGIVASNASGQGTGGLTLADVNAAIVAGATTLVEALQAACQANATCASSCVADATCILPVEMIYFKGEITEKNKVLLLWATASEEENAYFEVQTSTNGKVFSSIDKVEGAGTTIERKDYQWLDVNPLKGVNYYRLKQVDIDGTFEYSNIIAVDYQVKSQRNELKIVPNPVYDMISYGLNDSQSVENIQIFNMQGQLVLKNKTIDSQIFVGNLSSGIYLLQLDLGNQKIRKRFVKN